MSGYIEREMHGSVALLRLTRIKALNALNREMVTQLIEEAKLAMSEGARALVLTGEENFAAGADVGNMVSLTPEEAGSFLFSDSYSVLEELEIPTIAAICGYALGGGLELAMTCDFRIASDNAVMGLPEINLGIIPGAGGTVRLPRLIGEARAKEMIYLGRLLKAEEALSCGLVTEVVSGAELLERALGLAQKLAAKSSTGLSAAKKSITYSCQGRENPFDKESEIWSALFATPDQREGMQSFVEKRKPVFQ